MVRKIVILFLLFLNISNACCCFPTSCEPVRNTMSKAYTKGITSFKTNDDKKVGQEFRSKINNTFDVILTKQKSIVEYQKDIKNINSLISANNIDRTTILSKQKEIKELKVDTQSIASKLSLLEKEMEIFLTILKTKNAK